MADEAEMGESAFQQMRRRHAADGLVVVDDPRQPEPEHLLLKVDGGDAGPQH